MKNKSLKYLILALSIMQSACTNDNKPTPAVYDFEVYKSQEIKLADDDCYSGHEQLVNIDGEDVIVMNVGGKLSYYRLSDGKKIHETITHNSNRLESFYFINKDSIFLSFGCPYYSRFEEFEKPSAKMLVDYNGNIKKIYDYNADSCSLSVGSYCRDSILPAYGASGKIYICGDNVFFPVNMSWASMLGTKEFMKKQRPMISRLDIKENKYYFSKTKHYPFVSEGVYYQSVSEPVFITPSPSGLPLMSYFYSNVIFEWDWQNDSVYAHKVQSRLLDTVLPAKEPNQYEFEMPAQFHNIFYDAKDELFFRLMYFDGNVYGKRLFGLVVFDKDFNYLGEIYMQKSWPWLSNKNTLIDLYPLNDSTLKIDYLNVVRTDRNFDNYIDSCRNDMKAKRDAYDDLKEQLRNGNNAIVNMLKTQKEINESNYKILTLYTYCGCIGCVEAVAATLHEIKDIINKLPFYIIVSGNGKDEADREIEKYGLKSFNNLFIDEKGLLKSLAGSNYLLNPRITVVENGKVTLDTIYQAMDIEDKLLP
ncbi:MAG: DUF4221 family protein, partial [Bacteroidales bacterium]|nr:DUF4221 family protein [Bacteroidales bacterium]